MTRLAWTFALTLATAAAGCSNNDGPPGGDMPDMATPVIVPDMAMPPQPDLSLPARNPTDHPDFLQMTNNHGPVLKNPEIYTVVWAGDDALGARAEKFTKWFVQSDFFTGTLGEYGVQAGKSMGLIVLKDAPPPSLRESDVWKLTQKIIADSQTSGTPIVVNANTAFSYIVNAATKAQLSGASGCRDFGGYHTEGPLSGTQPTASAPTVPELVNLQCDPSFDSLTDVISHEASEASTDPKPYFHPAYVYRDVGSPLGGEVADLCTGLERGFDFIENADFPDGTTESYLLNRNWSNKAAAAGDKDPCQPTRQGRPFYNVVLDPMIPQYDIPPKGKIERDITLVPFAFGDVGNIKWQLQTDQPAGVEIDVTSGTAQAGQPVNIHVTIDPDQFDSTTNQEIQQYGGAEFNVYLFSQSAKAGGQQFTTSIVVAGSPR